MRSAVRTCPATEWSRRTWPSALWPGPGSPPAKQTGSAADSCHSAPSLPKAMNLSHNSSTYSLKTTAEECKPGTGIALRCEAALEASKQCASDAPQARKLPAVAREAQAVWVQATPPARYLQLLPARLTRASVPLTAGVVGSNQHNRHVLNVGLKLVSRIKGIRYEARVPHTP